MDARSPERFRGINETLDKVGGHIPGACNYFFQQNLTADKTFKSPDELRAQWQGELQGRDASDVVMYCGSGVTACHNLLALEVAGLPGSRIYPWLVERVERRPEPARRDLNSRAARHVAGRLKRPARQPRPLTLVQSPRRHSTRRLDT